MSCQQTNFWQRIILNKVGEYVMSVDWKKLDGFILKVVSDSTASVIEAANFDLGTDISTYPSLKIAFDGFGDDGEDETMASFALFVHEDSADPDFVFPPHEETPWAIVQRPTEEAIIYCWYNRDEDEWDILEPETENEAALNPEKLISILTKIIG